MRIDVKKFLFVGPTKIKEEFFVKAQEVGLVHFIEPDSSKTSETPLEVDHLITTIKVLRGLPTVEQEESNDYEKADGYVEKILSLRHQLESLHEESRVLNLEIARIGIFGDFSLDDLRYIEQEGNRRLQFFFAKKGAVSEVDNTLIYIGSEHGLDYFMAVNKELRQYDNMIEMQISTPLGKMEHRVEAIEREIQVHEQDLKTYAKFNLFLHHALVEKMNRFHLHQATSYADLELGDSLFAITGWVPKNKIEELEDSLRALEVHMEEVAIETTDVVPTCLQNQGAAKIGEDIIRVYDTPANQDKDPSLWVLGFFSLFFAMIMSDAGYGLVFLAIALALRWKYPKVKGVGKRMLNLFTLLSVACVGWGILVNSFFGIQIAPDNPLRNFSALQWLVEKRVDYHIKTKDHTYQSLIKEFPNLQGIDESLPFLKEGAVTNDKGQTSFVILNRFADKTLMELALFVGVVHIILSLLRYLKTNWAALGWITFILGCYLYFPNYLGVTTLVQYVLGVSAETAAAEGIVMIYGGLVGAVFLSVLQNKWYGLLEIATVIQIFGDVLSYLRLYALGLASAIISGVINDIASSMFVVGGILLILAGHAVNMLLGVIGGVIHGLRLNFLEWYHYSFHGGGKPYDPLRNIEVE